MATTTTTPRTTRIPTDWSLADVQNHVGGVPLERIRSFPPPGFAIVEDVVEIHAKEDRLYEMIDGILVEKTEGYLIVKGKTPDPAKKHTLNLSTEGQPTPINLAQPRSTHLPTDWNLADIQNHVGGVPLERIRAFPPPGFATDEDVEELNVRKDRLCELIDGILVEKTMGWYESYLAVLIISKLNNFVVENQSGLVLGPDGTLKVLPNQIRVPDVCFISWARFPDGKLPKKPAPEIAPDLAIEVLSKSNTKREMEQKLQDYFQAGVKLVWYIDPPTRSATVYTSAEDEGTEHSETEPLSGGDVLPGFELSLAEIFRQADSQAGR